MIVTTMPPTMTRRKRNGPSSRASGFITARMSATLRRGGRLHVEIDRRRLRLAGHVPPVEHPKSKRHHDGEDRADQYGEEGVAAARAGIAGIGCHEALLGYVLL